MPRDDAEDSLFLQPATAYRDAVTEGFASDPQLGPVLPRWQARFSPGTATRLDFDALPSNDQMAGMELAFPERAHTDEEAQELADPFIARAQWTGFAAALGVGALTIAAGPGVGHEPMTLGLSAVAFVALFTLGSRPTRFLKEWLYTYPKLTPKTRREHPKRHPTDVYPSLVFFAFVTMTMLVLAPKNHTAALIVVGGVAIVVALFPMASLTPFAHLHLLRRLLWLYLTYGERSSNAPGIWRPKAPLEARRGTLTTLVVAVAAWVNVGLYFCFPQERFSSELVALYERDPRLLAFRDVPMGWVLAVVDAGRDFPSLIAGGAAALLLAAVFPVLILLALYRPALARLVRLEKDIRENLDSFESYRDEEGKPIRRTDWQWMVDRIRDSKHTAPMPAIAQHVAGKPVREADHLFLGVEPGFHFPVLLHRDIVKQHLYICGQTGSGKTSLGLTSLLLQLLRPHRGPDGPVPPPPVVIIDLKGDLAMFHTVKAEVEARTYIDPTTGKSRKQRFRAFTLEPGWETQLFNPFQTFDPARRTPAQVTEIVLNSLDLAHGPGYGRGYFTEHSRFALRSALERLWPRVQAGETITFEDIGRTLKGNKEAFHLAAVIEALTEFPQLLATTNPADDPEGVIWMPRLLEDREVAYFHLGAPEQSITAREVANLVIYSLVTAARDRERDGRGVQSYAFLDEFQAVISRGFLPSVTKARSGGVAFIMASQSFAQLKTPDGDFRDEMLGTIGARLFFTVSRVDAEDLVAAAGEELIAIPQVTVSEMQNLQGEVQTGRAVAWQRKLRPALARNDLNRISSYPRDLIAHVMQGDGYTQYGGAPFQARTSWPLAFDLYERRRNRPWPRRVEATRGPDPRVVDSGIDRRRARLEADQDALGRTDRSDRSGPQRRRR